MTYTGNQHAYRGLDTSSLPQFVWDANTTHEAVAVTDDPVVLLTIPAGCTGLLIIAADATSELVWITPADESDRARVGGSEGPQHFFTGIDPDNIPDISVRANAVGTSNVNVLYFTR